MGNFNTNRTLCALSGQVGKYLAQGIDTAAKIAGADAKTTEKARLAVGQLAAFLLASTGAPEAAVSILSATAAMPSNPLDLSNMEEVEATAKT
jgi:hypothetical protein